ncbi:hypothetical protein MKW92_000992 [Papaver armeniacum]|nr:hypothetical protein MKW92_000992 [Papaver armeniacum]
MIEKSQNLTTRRSANYEPSAWDHDFVQSLNSDYAKNYTKQYEKLKEKVRLMFADQACRESLSSTLKLINVIQRVGVNTINKKNYGWEEDDLFTRALWFRLLRQHRYEVSQDVFKRFIMEEMMNTSSAFNDVEGMLSVYEASFYAFDTTPNSWNREEMLDEAQKLTTKTLEEYLQSPPAKDEGTNTCITERLVRHIRFNFYRYLIRILPFQWITPRVEARWYIDTYEMIQDMDPLLLEFTKLDLNILQAKYQDELKHISRWWKELGCIELLSFSRNRFVELFVWTVWCNFEPEFDISREEITKFGVLGNPVDDTYDWEMLFYRWDVNKIVDLPDYMELLFLAVYNTANAIAYMVLKKRGLDILSYLKKVWADFCNAYFLEAKWYYNGREHIKHMIHDLWKKMNGDEYSRSIFPRQFIDFVENYARSCHCVYQFKDWYGGKAGTEMKNRVISLLAKPIPTEKNSVT